MTFFKKCLRLSQIHDLCISRWKNLIFSKGHREKIEFLIFLSSSIILEAMKKKLGTCSFPKYFYANLQDVVCPSQKINFAQSTRVTNKCCCICFSDEKDHLRVTPQAPGGRGHPWGIHGVKAKVVQMKKISETVSFIQ